MEMPYNAFKLFSLLTVNCLLSYVSSFVLLVQSGENRVLLLMGLYLVGESALAPDSVATTSDSVATASDTALIVSDTVAIASDYALSIVADSLCRRGLCH